MISRRIASIFRVGSRTYFYSSVFFPANVRQDVFKLYAFVRVADDFVDQVPQDTAGFHGFVARYRSALDGESAGDEIIDQFVELASRKALDPAWVNSFLGAMGRDLTQSSYDTMSELEEYMYGSAEVVGLMMARILELPEAAHESAQRLGTAMQYLNFLRDMEHDERLGRTYLPRSILDEHGLASPCSAAAKSDPGRFSHMMRSEVRRYLQWQSEADEGFKYLRRRYRIPIETAADMYRWTALEIHEDPMRVFERQIKPSVPQILMRVARNALKAAMRPEKANRGGRGDSIRPSQ